MDAVNITRGIVYSVTNITEITRPISFNILAILPLVREASWNTAVSISGPAISDVEQVFLTTDRLRNKWGFNYINGKKISKPGRPLYV